MKKLVAAMFVFFASLNAMALGPSDSWDAIRASNKYFVSAVFPVFGPAGVFNACATPTQIQTIAPIKVCAEMVYVPGYGEQSGGMECTRTEVRHMSVDRRGMGPVCVKWAPVTESSNGECLAYEDRPYEISLTQLVEVLYRGGANYAGVAFVKSFTIPACN